MSMASRKDKTIIILPIWPVYCDLIFSGVKKVELRKGNIPLGIKHVLIYETSPSCRIIGYFDVSSVVESTPANIWKHFNRTCAVEKRFFDQYYDRCTTGRAIVIGSVSKFARSCTLSDLGMKDMRAPQSFSYINSGTWKIAEGKKSVLVWSQKANELQYHKELK